MDVTSYMGVHFGKFSNYRCFATDTRCQNVGNQLPTYAVQHPTTAKAPTTRQQKPKISYEHVVFYYI